MATGRFLQASAPHNQLMLSLIHAMGLHDVQVFGDASLCKGPLPGLAA